jgi:DNA-directed RNA polymerase subunit RPC12/RpoP
MAFRGAFEFDEFDDDLEEDTLACPECGSDDLEIIGEDEEGNIEYECADCGERFTDAEEEDS